MAFKLKTSKKTEEILTQIESSTNIPYATLIKLSLALSLRKGSLQNEDFKTNNLGRELNRQTITGDADALYKCLFLLEKLSAFILIALCLYPALCHSSGIVLYRFPCL